MTGPGERSIVYLKRIEQKAEVQSTEFPFSIPVFRNFGLRRINTPILLFAGDNGSGKSTLLEAIAIGTRLGTAGSADARNDPYLREIAPLTRSLRLGWARKTRIGFFLRAEDFFGFARRNRRIGGELQDIADQITEPEDAWVKGYILGQKRALNRDYGRPLEAFSHGEGFLCPPT